MKGTFFILSLVLLKKKKRKLKNTIKLSFLLCVVTPLIDLFQTCWFFMKTYFYPTSIVTCHKV